MHSNGAGTATYGLLTGPSSNDLILLRIET